MSYTVYILRTSKGTLYTGQTNNLEKRLQEHASKSKRSAKYMRAFDSFQLVWQEPHPTRTSAMQREAKIKQLSKTEKEELVRS
jgi:putative endonuclease